MNRSEVIRLFRFHQDVTHPSPELLGSPVTVRLREAAALLDGAPKLTSPEARANVLVAALQRIESVRKELESALEVLAEPEPVPRTIPIVVGRVEVLMSLRPEERIYEVVGDGQFDAEIVRAGKSTVLGRYASIEAAAKALYLEREDFSAAYGA